MRPIKFRAWHIGFKQMGFLDQLWNNHWYSTPRGDAPDKGKIVFDNSNVWMGAHARSGKDIVLMQFTGLLDKNGKEIFEGDIVRLKKFIGGNWVDHKIQRFVVVFDKFSFQLKPIDSAIYTVSMVLGDDCEIEIIGSIYENPELLK